MKKTTTENAERASGSRSSTSRSDAKKPKGLSFDLRLRYNNRMTLQRVYPLIVEVPPGTNTKGPTGLTVELRPVVAGAVVTPAVQRLDVTRPGARATFQVAPLVRGRLPAAHVDVIHEGRTIQELRMGMKAGTQRGTWLLLLLTLVLPPLFYHYTVFEPLREQIPLRSLVPAPTKPEGEGANAEQPQGNGQPPGEKPADKPQDKPNKPPVGGLQPGKPPVGGPPGNPPVGPPRTGHTGGGPPVPPPPSRAARRRSLAIPGKAWSTKSKPRRRRSCRSCRIVTRLSMDSRVDWAWPISRSVSTRTSCFRGSG